MRVNNKKYYDDATLKEAVSLIEEAKLTIVEICKELHTSVPTLRRNMNHYFKISKDEGKTDWRESYKTKYNINKKKERRMRIVWECAMCGGESKLGVEQCQRCGSYCVNRRELQNKLTSAELRSVNKQRRRGDK